MNDAEEVISLLPAPQHRELARQRITHGDAPAHIGHAPVVEVDPATGDSAPGVALRDGEPGPGQQVDQRESLAFQCAAGNFA